MTALDMMPWRVSMGGLDWLGGCVKFKSRKQQEQKKKEALSVANLST